MSGVNFPDLEWKVDVTNLPRGGAAYWFEADAETLAGLAAPLGLASLERFALSVKITSRKKRGFYVAGQLEGDAVQSCVVTLEPVQSRMVENFERFLIAQKILSEQDPEIELPREVIFDPTEDDPPDIFDGKTIDIGLIALEEFALLLDPYPRHLSAGEWLDKEYSGQSSQSGQDAGDGNPFAVLNKLKTD